MLRHLMILFVAAFATPSLSLAVAQTTDAEFAKTVKASLRGGCLDGNVDTCLQLGEISMRGEFRYDGKTYSIDTSWVDALVAWGKACDLGSGDGCYRLARAMDTGEIPQSDQQKITARFAKGCELGHANACFQESKRHSDGVGTAKSEALALLRLERGCELGDADICHIVGLEYEILSQEYSLSAASELLRLMNGEKTISTPDDAGMVFRSKAYQYLSKACSLGVKDACAEVEGEKPLDVHVTLCDQGNAKSCDALGEIYSSRNLQDDAKSFQYYKRACDLGNADGCTSYAAYVRYGIGTARNDSLAFKTFSQACDMGSASGCANAATMVKRGHGTAQDAAREKAFYKRACDLGEARYCNR